MHLLRAMFRPSFSPAMLGTGPARGDPQHLERSPYRGDRCRSGRLIFRSPREERVSSAWIEQPLGQEIRDLLIAGPT